MQKPDPTIRASVARALTPYMVTSMDRFQQAVDDVLEALGDWATDHALHSIERAAAADRISSDLSDCGDRGHAVMDGLLALSVSHKDDGRAWAQYDCTNPETMLTPDGKQPEEGDRVARIKDLSGNGHDMVWTSGAPYPIWRDGCVEFPDGVAIPCSKESKGLDTSHP